MTENVVSSIAKKNLAPPVSKETGSKCVILFAATPFGGRKGDYYGPDKLNETGGYRTNAKPPKQPLETCAASQLRDLSEKLSSVELGEQLTLLLTAGLPGSAIDRGV